MTWSIYDGTPKDSHQDLFKYARLKTPNAKALFAGLEWANDSDWYIQHAFENGLDGLTPAEIIQLNDWYSGDFDDLLAKCKTFPNYKEIMGFLEYSSYDSQILINLIKSSIYSGQKFTDEQMFEICNDIDDDSSIQDAYIMTEIAHGRIFKVEEILTDTKISKIISNCTPKVCEEVIRHLNRHLNYDEATELTYRIREDYTDETVEQIVSVTDCSKREKDYFRYERGYNLIDKDPFIAELEEQQKLEAKERKRIEKEERLRAEAEKDLEWYKNYSTIMQMLAEDGALEGKPGWTNKWYNEHFNHNKD